MKQPKEILILTSITAIDTPEGGLDGARYWSTNIEHIDEEAEAYAEAIWNQFSELTKDGLDIENSQPHGGSIYLPVANEHNKIEELREFDTHLRLNNTFKDKIINLVEEEITKLKADLLATQKTLNVPPRHHTYLVTNNLVAIKREHIAEINPTLDIDQLLKDNLGVELTREEANIFKDAFENGLYEPYTVDNKPTKP
jgi:hypothetical protein